MLATFVGTLFVLLQFIYTKGEYQQLIAPKVNDTLIPPYNTLFITAPTGVLYSNTTIDPFGTRKWTQLFLFVLFIDRRFFGRNMCFRNVLQNSLFLQNLLLHNLMPLSHFCSTICPPLLMLNPCDPWPITQYI